MATSFDKIYEGFLDKIRDPYFFDITQELREKILRSLMSASVVQFAHISKTDLSELNEEEKEFINDISSVEIDILATGMVWAWYNTKLNHSDLLENFLSTKDYSMAAAPSNMLKEVRNTRDEAWLAFKRAMNTYSYAYGSIESLKPQG